MSYQPKMTRRKRDRAQQKAWRLTVVSVAVMVLTVAGGTYLYQTKNQPLDTSRLSASFRELTDWFTAHKARLNKKIVKVQQMTAKNAEEPIHFEFYSELPKMKVPVPKKTEETK